MSGWGKAGVRLTPAEVEAHRRKAAKRRNTDRARSDREMNEGRRIWVRGLIVPRQISTALDLVGAEGPDVDVACGAVEPEVDRWEAAELYPTWEQFVLLARYTGFAMQWFGHDAPDIEGGIMCIRSGKGRGCHPIPKDVRPRRFPRTVVDERVGA